MATLEATATRRERMPAAEWDWYGLGSRKYRLIYEVVLSWPCDDSGGETVNATETHSGSGVVCRLQSAVPEIPPGRRLGVFTAVYRGEGAWVLL